MDFHAYQAALAEEFRGQECPFTVEEFDRRLQATRARMASNGLGALLLTDPSDVFYLTGYSTFEVSVHIALVVTADSLVLQVPSIETGPATITTRLAKVIGYRWESIEAVLDPLADEVKGHGDRLGIDSWHGSLRTGVVEGLRARLPGIQLVDASGLLKPIRIVKSAAEIECLRRSAQMTGQGMEAAASAVSPGKTDNDIAAIGAQTLLACGSEFMSMQPIVTTGKRSSVIHTNHKRVTINEGEPVFLEFGAVFQRYTAPMMRTVIAGTPTAEMREVFDGCRRIVDALQRTMIPGQTFDSAAKAAETALAPLAGKVFFSGVFGYTVGAQFPPSWVEGSGFIARGETAVFETGMVFHLPICLRIPGQWGMGFSDTVVVAENGAEALTSNPWVLD
ncbi:Xaa-Pro peptidase family protein [Marinobacter sp. CHS3-4]|uniref:M24 family metallopeptidase n=1 Tax=Marinobacter sp. CHS3-4 TaxID=3045174 RepID=UPI0024B4875D|nr:Xaa-Pro peptidase family protein [Marinobacter sp. CHS3-4]MDI9244772.1 Xaa-Pro peptidase family protein [Marinobacter sp. CHS3-4]